MEILKHSFEEAPENPEPFFADENVEWDMAAGQTERYPGNKPLLLGVAFERDKVIRYQAFIGRTEALEAAGLSQQAARLLGAVPGSLSH